jgi:pyruvate/2-oxoglutarate dehydrogenase complex dihydrolipoamide dehydrogenase (E3) component
MTSIKCDIAIVGAGASGLSLAAGAAQMGADVVLVESGKMGGDCLNYGCVPSKALLACAKQYWQATHSQSMGVVAHDVCLDFEKVMAHVQKTINTIAVHDSKERFESLGVRVIKETGYFKNNKTLCAGEYEITAKRFVLATGSSPAQPLIPGLKSINYETNETIFSHTTLPKHLVVIGGGPIGCEMAQAFAMLGSKVTMLVRTHVLPKDDPACSAYVRDALSEFPIDIIENVSVESVSQDAAGIISVAVEKEGAKKIITGTTLLVCAGRKANTHGLFCECAHVECSSRGVTVNARLQTTNKKIYAMGDVCGPYLFTHMAGYHAGIVLKNILFKWPSKCRYDAVPWVTYTDPEIAHVGLSTERALAHEKITQWMFKDNDRAESQGQTAGLIKVITGRKEKILGVTIVGPRAGELLLPWIIAVREKKSLRSFTDAIVPYPTLSEISKRVSGHYYTPSLFSPKVKKIVRWILRFTF